VKKGIYMFKNLKIGMKLALGFLFVSLLLIVNVFTSILSMNKMNDATDEIVADRYMKINMTNENISRALRVGGYTRNLVFVSTACDLLKKSNLSY
jgi:methyl-accepting chemotaxis protein